MAALSTGDATARPQLVEHIRTSRSMGWDELASTAFSQLATLDVEHHRLAEAAEVLTTSLPFAREREIWICNHLQTSVRARVGFALGRWDEALADAAEVLDDEGMPMAKLWPHLLTALVPLRRKGTPHTESMAAAWDLMCSIDEPLRRLPVYSGLAEIMWMTGVPDERVSRDAVAQLDAVAGTPGADWVVGELAAWLVRLGIPTSARSSAPPYAAVAAGKVDEAAAWWAGNCEPFAQALVLADSGDTEHRARAAELLVGIGAQATAERVRRLSAVASA